MTTEPLPASAPPGMGMNFLSGELQQLVDSCAGDIRRSVAIDDMHMKMLAVSAHYGDEDPARLRALVGRGLDRPTVDYLLSAGVAQLTDPAWVGGVPELGLETRLFVPIRCNNMPLGFLVLIDRDRSLQAGIVDRAIHAAELAGLILYRQLMFQEWERRRDEALLRDLTSTEDAVSDRAVREIHEGSLITGTEFMIMEIRLADGMSESDMLDTRSRIGAYLRSEKQRTVIWMFSGRRTVLLGHYQATERLINRFVQLVDSGNAAIGVSGAFNHIGDASQAYGEASIAVRAAELLPALNHIARWQDLGVYAVLMRLPPAELAQNAWTPAILRLAEADLPDLINTAEEFLDCAGDSKRTAERLHIHRSTLYYRLRRIEEISGLNLQEGSDRLLLHLGLKARRVIAVATEPAP